MQQKYRRINRNFIEHFYLLRIAEVLQVSCVPPKGCKWEKNDQSLKYTHLFNPMCASTYTREIQPPRVPVNHKTSEIYLWFYVSRQPGICARNLNIPGTPVCIGPLKGNILRAWAYIRPLDDNRIRHGWGGMCTLVLTVALKPLWSRGSAANTVTEL